MDSLNKLLLRYSINRIEKVKEMHFEIVVVKVEIIKNLKISVILSRLANQNSQKPTMIYVFN